MTTKALWFLLACSALIIGFYPSIYFLIDEKFGLLNSKSDALLSTSIWRIGFYTHIILGGIALSIGWAQFSKKIRNRNPKLHRAIGKVYVVAVLLSGTAGIGIGFYATGGLIPALGFISLGLLWLYTTIMAYIHIKKGRILSHQKCMMYSYAACFAAVTLRIWLPLLIFTFGSFTIAYPIVAWLSWVPNLVVAYFLTKRLGHH